MSPASTRHQRISSLLAFVLPLVVDRHGLGGELLVNVLVRLETSTGPAARAPDLVYVGRRSLDRIRANHVDGPVDLVVEIVSPESVDRDRGRKRDEYEAAGITEYWIIDPVADDTELLRLDADGRYRSVEPDSEGRLTFESLDGFPFPTRRLLDDPPPSPVALARELGLLD